MKKQRIAELTIFVLLMGTILFTMEFNKVESQVKTIGPGAWERIVDEIEQVSTAYPIQWEERFENFAFEYTMEAEEATALANWVYPTKMPETMFPVGTSEPLKTGIFHYRMHYPPGLTQYGTWREVVNGRVYEIRTMISRDYPNRGFLKWTEGEGIDAIGSFLEVPGEKGEMKILRREGNLIVLESTNLGELLSYDFIRRELHDGSGKVIAIATTPPPSFFFTPTPLPTLDPSTTPEPNEKNLPYP